MVSLLAQFQKVFGRKAEKPDASTLLQQNTSYGDISGWVQSIIGVFNPRLVDHNTRLLMRLDADVAFAMAIIRSALINMRWTVQSKNPEHAAFVEANLRTLWPELAKALAFAPFFGFRVIEPALQAGPFSFQVKGKTDGSATWKTLPNAWTYRKFRPIDSRTLVLVPDENGEFAGVRQSSGLTSGKEGLAPASRLIYWCFRSEDVDGRLDGFPLFDQIYEPWYWKSAMNLFANRYFERLGDPIPKGRAPADGKDSNGKRIDGQTLLSNQISAVRAGGHYVLPATLSEKGDKFLYDVELMEASGNAPVAHQARIQQLRTQILNGLLIPEESVAATDTGGRARSAEHGDRLDENLQSIQGDMVGVLNTQAVPRILGFNYAEEQVRDSDTRIVASGLSSSEKMFYKELLFKVMDQELASPPDGKKIFTRQLVATRDILNSLESPMTPEDEIEPEAAPVDPLMGDVPSGKEISPEEEAAAAEELKRRGAAE